VERPGLKYCDLYVMTYAVVSLCCDNVGVLNCLVL